MSKLFNNMYHDGHHWCYIRDPSDAEDSVGEANSIDWWWNELKKENKEQGIKKQSECFHDWAEYKGFNDNFWYCKKCDKKKDLA